MDRALGEPEVLVLLTLCFASYSLRIGVKYPFFGCASWQLSPLCYQDHVPGTHQGAGRELCLLQPGQDATGCSKGTSLHLDLFKAEKLCEVPWGKKKKKKTKRRMDLADYLKLYLCVDSL